MPTGSLPGTSTAPVPPGVFATSMPPLVTGACKPVDQSFNSYHVNGSSSNAQVNNKHSCDDRTPSPSIDDCPDSQQEERNFKRFSKAHKPGKRTYQETFKTSAHPLKLTLRRCDGDPSINSHSPSKIPESYTCEKIPESSSSVQLNCDTTISENKSKDELDSNSLPPAKTNNPPIKDEINPSLSKSTQQVPSRVNQPVISDQQQQQQQNHRDASTCTIASATVTEPDLLGPCEPGSRILLDGVVWVETPGSFLSPSLIR
ncbi:hypothetical protein Ciccas_009810 [Cichlidogyrus casuarinus]|uniref:Uncharacterized protein n=1 Tax=Cichlidogyrus casuarinus TaxID=1844966 RepID=A0ABD2PXS2_9PLAT